MIKCVASNGAVQATSTDLARSRDGPHSGARAHRHASSTRACARARARAPGGTTCAITQLMLEIRSGSQSNGTRAGTREAPHGILARGASRDPRGLTPSPTVTARRTHAARPRLQGLRRIRAPFRERPSRILSRRYAALSPKMLLATTAMVACGAALQLGSPSSPRSIRIPRVAQLLDALRFRTPTDGGPVRREHVRTYSTELCLQCRVLTMYSRSQSVTREMPQSTACSLLSVILVLENAFLTK